MKLYKVNYNMNQPTLKQINVPSDSTFKVGITVEKDGEKLDLKPTDVTLKNGETTISALSDEYHDMVVFDEEVYQQDKQYKVAIETDFVTELSGQKISTGVLPGPASQGVGFVVSVDVDSPLIGMTLDPNKIIAAKVLADRLSSQVEVSAIISVEPPLSEFTNKIQGTYMLYYYSVNGTKVYAYQTGGTKHWSSSYIEDVPVPAPVVEAGAEIKWGSQNIVLEKTKYTGISWFIKYGDMPIKTDFNLVENVVDSNVTDI